MRLYYVNPADLTDITLLGVPPLFNVTLPSGRTIERIDGELIDVHVYDSINESPPLPAYNTQTGVNLAFEGAFGTPSGTVRETNVYTQLPIADLYEIKSDEVRQQDDDVRYNAVDTSLSVNWWIVVTEKAQAELLWIASGSNSRELRSQAWPTGPNQPVFAIYNTNNNRVRREPIPNQGVWDTIEEEIALHLQNTSNATKASGDALDAKYDNGNGVWQEVADHDPADPAWGYPPTVNGALMRKALRQ